MAAWVPNKRRVRVGQGLRAHRCAVVTIYREHFRCDTDCLEPAAPIPVIMESVGCVELYAMP